MRRILLLTVLLVPVILLANTWKEGDRVEVLSKDKWFPGIIQEVQEKGFLVNFDGYSDSYDEVVDAAKIRAAKPVDGISYITTGLDSGAFRLNGNLKTGKIIRDLRWAERSDIACWPGIRNVEFQGKHVFYWFDLPDHSEAKITVKPLNGKRINLYVYAFDGKSVPPLKYPTRQCDAAHPAWIGQPDFSKPPEPQSLDVVAITTRQMYAIGVAGAKGVEEGDFELMVEVKR